MKQKSLRQLAKELGVSVSYLFQVKNGKRPASQNMVSRMVSNGKHEQIVLDMAGCYNLGVLGNRLVVGQRTLNPSRKVRILLPQPSKIRIELLPAEINGGIEWILVG